MIAGSANRRGEKTTRSYCYSCTNNTFFYGMGKLKDTRTHAECERERKRWILNQFCWVEWEEQECVLEIHFMLMCWCHSLPLTLSQSHKTQSNWRVFCVREQFFMWYRIDLISFVDVFIIVGVAVVVVDFFFHTSVTTTMKNLITYHR